MGEEGKPHSTKKGRIAAGVRRIKRLQKEKVFVEAGSKAKGLGKGKYFSKEFDKEKTVADPNETVGGRYQEPLRNIKRPAGLGAALRGGGRAFMKGGKV